MRSEDKKYVDYIIEKTVEVLSVDSPTGYTKEAADHVCKAYKELGYEPAVTVKGGVLVDLTPDISSDSMNDGGILLEAHIDTLGAMVAEVKGNGRLKLTPLGGLNPNNAEAENCRVITRRGKKYEGTFQLANASIHVNGKYDDTKRSYDDMEVVLDEAVNCAEEVIALGIMPGDIVAFEPRTRITESGYIKSRFLDDKLSVGILLGFAKWLKEEGIAPKRKVYHHITVYEEVGHGASGTVPADVTEILSVDMGCVGEGLGCGEHQVSICAKDSRGPYNYDVVGALIDAAKSAEIDFAVDVYPYYGSDADAALAAGYDVRHGLIGAGVYASHGYERSHIDGVANTFALLKAYLT
ncbi:MAG: M42 family metallopeptidase [Lachnospiraceae bacterium]|nr:M42 family metallopeptidase [Lachnospiraceae bacterium]